MYKNYGFNHYTSNLSIHLIKSKSQSKKKFTLKEKKKVMVSGGKGHWNKRLIWYGKTGSRQSYSLTTLINIGD